MPRKISNKELKSLDIDRQPPVLGKRNVKQPQRRGSKQPSLPSVASPPPGPRTPVRTRQRTLDSDLAIAVGTPLPLSPEAVVARLGTGVSEQQQEGTGRVTPQVIRAFPTQSLQEPSLPPLSDPAFIPRGRINLPNRHPYNFRNNPRPTVPRSSLTYRTPAFQQLREPTPAVTQNSNSDSDSSTQRESTRSLDLGFRSINQRPGQNCQQSDQWPLVTSPSELSHRTFNSSLLLDDQLDNMEPAGPSSAPARDPATTSSSSTPQSEQDPDAQIYSKNEYRRDAEFILLICDLPKEEIGPYMANMLDDTLIGMAREAVAVLDAKTRQDNRDKAIQRFRSDDHVFTEAGTQVFLARFNTGPMPSPEPPAGAESAQERRRRRQFPGFTPVPPDSVRVRPLSQARAPPDAPIIPSSPVRSHVPTTQGRYQPPPREWSMFPSIAHSHYGHQLPYGSRSPWAVPTQPIPPQHQNHYPGPPVAPPYGTGLLSVSTRRRDRKLKASDMGEFNGQGVTLFVQRITSMVNRYGHDAVLEVLPLCMRGEAQQQYDVLHEQAKAIMDNSIDDWIVNLRSRFARDPIRAEQEIDQCKFWINKKDILPLRDYVTKKQGLLMEANITEPAQVAMRIWKDLDPMIQATVPRPDPFMPLEAFIQRLYAAEFSSENLWKSVQYQTRHASAPSRPQQYPTSPRRDYDRYTDTRHENRYDNSRSDNRYDGNRAYRPQYNGYSKPGGNSYPRSSPGRQFYTGQPQSLSRPQGGTPPRGQNSPARTPPRYGTSYRPYNAQSPRRFNGNTGEPSKPFTIKPRVHFADEKENVEPVGNDLIDLQDSSENVQSGR